MAQPPSSKGANHSTQTSAQKIVKPLQVSCVGQIPVLEALHIVITGFDSADIIPNSGGFVGLSSRVERVSSIFHPTVRDSIEIPKSHWVFNNPVHGPPPP